MLSLQILIILGYYMYVLFNFYSHARLIIILSVEIQNDNNKYLILKWSRRTFIILTGSLNQYIIISDNLIIGFNDAVCDIFMTF